MTSHEMLLFKKKDYVGVITFNRPQALNAMNQQVFSELSRFQTKWGRIEKYG